MNLYYCSTCGLRIHERLIQNSVVQVIQERAKCLTCAPKVQNPPVVTTGLTRKKTRQVLVFPVKTPSRKSTFVFAGVVFLGILGVGLLSSLRVTKPSERFDVRQSSSVNSSIPEKRGTPAEVNTPQLAIAASTTVKLPLGTVSAPSVSASVSSPQDDTYDPRASVAASVLAEAKAYFTRHPNSPWTYREKLNALIERYRHTPAADEAAKTIHRENYPSYPKSKDVTLPTDVEWAKALELIDLIDLNTDMIRPGWTRNQSRLISNGPHSFIGVPYIPPDEYDLKVNFMRTEGVECLAINLPRADRSCTFLLSAFGGSVHGFEMIKGCRGPDVPDNLNRSDLVPNRKSHELILQVRRDCMRAYLNGEFLCETKAKNHEMSVFEHWNLPKVEQLAIGSWASQYQVNSLKVLEWVGTGSLIRKPRAESK